jgi:hypothetical protein
MAAEPQEIAVSWGFVFSAAVFDRFRFESLNEQSPLSRA